MNDLDLVIVGGCGHVGLPLALSLAECGYRVGINDIDQAKIDQVKAGRVPFSETGAEALLSALLPTGRLELSPDPAMLRRTKTIILVIGTPIDEFMNPSVRIFERVLDDLTPHVQSGSLVVLRSTVYPGTTETVERRLRAAGIEAEVAFCPERIAEGHALEELRTLPQLVGVNSDAAFAKAKALFERMGVSVVRTTPLESELAKLLTNTWRYMKFAIANQFFQIVNRSGLDYNRVLNAIRQDYPRAQDLPGPGFAAGPCLLKDTMQLSAFTSDHFPMGQAAMQVKGESDDPRASLSYKLRKLAQFKGAKVMCTDPYVPDPSFEPLDKVLRESDVIVVGAPHRVYRNLELDGREVVDIWGVAGPIRL
ncbi:MAG: nucleotide sugar dehydrogenase [Chloroflexi bacterium]|nr:MAG: nucleotide sugar dehydrogenase [Chloroflexota bacterium]